MLLADLLRLAEVPAGFSTSLVLSEHQSQCCGAVEMDTIANKALEDVQALLDVPLSGPVFAPGSRHGTAQQEILASSFAEREALKQKLGYAQSIVTGNLTRRLKTLTKLVAWTATPQEWAALLRVRDGEHIDGKFKYNACFANV